MLGSFPPELSGRLAATSLLRAREPTLSCNHPFRRLHREMGGTARPYLLIRPSSIATLIGCPTLAMPLFLSLGWGRTMQISWAGPIRARSTAHSPAVRRWIGNEKPCSSAQPPGEEGIASGVHNKISLCACKPLRLPACASTLLLIHSCHNAAPARGNYFPPLSPCLKRRNHS